MLRHPYFLLQESRLIGSLAVALAIVCDLIRVLFRSRASVIVENLFLRRQLALYQERKTRRHRPNSRHEIRLGDPEPILPLGERSGDCEAGYFRPLAQSGIPSLLALEVSSRRSSSATQEPALNHHDDGAGESELGRWTDRRRVVAQTGSVGRSAYRQAST
jgi:hypothetical protein